MRISIKSALFVITCIAIGVVLYQRFLFEKRWSPVRKQLENWLSQQEDSERETTGWARTVVNKNDSMTHLVFATSRAKVVGNSISFFPKSNDDAPMGKNYFIHPPGIWVSDVETALRVWDKQTSLKQ